MYIRNNCLQIVLFVKKDRVRVMRNAISNGIIMGMSIALLWHFSNIWRYGQYFIGEPNILVRSLETAGLMVILAFGVSKFVSDLK